MTSAIRIRRATLFDFGPVAHLFDLYRRFYEQEPDIHRARAFMSERLSRGDSIVLLATDETDAPLGFCQIYPSFCSILAEPIYILSDLFVDPAARRGGIGRALLQTAHEHARAEGVARLDLTTAKTNFKAQALYESLGWRRDEVYYAYNLSV